jgi:hypothetical protein
VWWWFITLGGYWVYWMRLALSNGPNGVGPPPARQLRTKRVSETLCSLDYWTMDKVQEPSNSAYFKEVEVLLGCAPCGLVEVHRSSFEVHGVRTQKIALLSLKILVVYKFGHLSNSCRWATFEQSHEIAYCFIVDLSYWMPPKSLTRDLKDELFEIYSESIHRYQLADWSFYPRREVQC